MTKRFLLSSAAFSAGVFCLFMYVGSLWAADGVIKQDDSRVKQDKANLQKDKQDIQNANKAIAADRASGNKEQLAKDQQAKKEAQKLCRKR